jgi:hypothetical protein
MKILKNCSFDDYLSAVPYAMKDLKSKTRAHDLVEWRYLGMLLYYRECYSLTKTGLMFNRDHSTVIHAFERLNNPYLIKHITPKIEKIERMSRLRRQYEGSKICSPVKFELKRVV